MTNWLHLFCRAKSVDLPATSNSLCLIRHLLQDLEQGGLSDRPEDQADVWHTVFGIAGLSLLGHPGLAEVDPVYCMPRSVTSKLQVARTVFDA